MAYKILDFSRGAPPIFAQLKRYHADLALIRATPIELRTSEQSAVLSQWEQAQIPSGRSKLIKGAGVALGVATLAGFGVGAAAALSGGVATVPVTAAPAATPAGIGLSVEAALPAYAPQIATAQTLAAAAPVAAAPSVVSWGAKAAAAGVKSVIGAGVTAATQTLQNALSPAGRETVATQPRADNAAAGSKTPLVIAALLMALPVAVVAFR